jgi:hypothetical protein
MDTKTVTINRRSIVGFGYTTSLENDERGKLVVSSTTKPDFAGTIKQVAAAINGDRTLKSISSGGTYYSTAWFVKLAGKFHRLVPRQAFNPSDLLRTAPEQDMTGRWVEPYIDNQINVIVEA